MNTESGKVVALDDTWVWVETIQNSACTACSAKSACGQHLLNSIFQSKRHYVKTAKAAAKAQVQLHDVVELSIAEHVLLKSAFWLYILPLALIMAGAMLANLWFVGESELYILLGAGIGFAVGLLLAAWQHRRQQNNPDFQPIISKVLAPGQSIAKAEPINVS